MAAVRGPPADAPRLGRPSSPELESAQMTRTLTTTPAADGFRMPAEFEAHAGCWMLWPERPDNWREGARPAQLAFAHVAATIARFERVTVGASRAQYEFARALMPEGVRVVELSSDDCWMRDTGPTFVVNGQGDVRGIHWRFNAWGGLQGGLYFPWDQDELVARKVLEIEERDRYRAPIVNEGGAIHVDGEGTALVTEQCLLQGHRNPGLAADAIEDVLRRYLGVSRIIWLGRGVVNDETDGHIDNLACFVRPGEVALTGSDTEGWTKLLWGLALGGGLPAGRRILVDHQCYDSHYLGLLQVCGVTGSTLHVVPAAADGTIDLDALAAELAAGDVALVCATHVGTHRGLVNPVEEVGDRCRVTGTLFFLDACQSVGQLPVDVGRIGCAAATATGHVRCQNRCVAGGVTDNRGDRRRGR